MMRVFRALVMMMGVGCWLFSSPNVIQFRRAPDLTDKEVRLEHDWSTRRCLLLPLGLLLD